MDPPTPVVFPQVRAHHGAPVGGRGQQQQLRAAGVEPRVVWLPPLMLFHARPSGGPSVRGRGQRQRFPRGGSGTGAGAFRRASARLVIRRHPCHLIRRRGAPTAIVVGGPRSRLPPCPPAQCRRRRRPHPPDSHPSSSGATNGAARVVTASDRALRVGRVTWQGRGCQQRQWLQWTQGGAGGRA